MPTTRRIALLLGLLPALVLSVLPHAGSAPASASDPPASRSVAVAATVEGSAVTVFPDYSPAVTRYAVVPDAETAGSLTVTAHADDGTIQVDGRPATSGQPVTVEGLTTGDEVNVLFRSGDTVLSQSWIYLPAGYPVPDVTVDHTEQQAPGYYTAALATFLTPASFETVFDHHGVPIHVRDTDDGTDLKSYDDAQGRALYYTVARPVGGSGLTADHAIERLDLRFRTVASYSIPEEHAAFTDFHDSVVRPDGSALLMGGRSRTDDEGTWLDAVIAVLPGPGEPPSFVWSSGDHVDPDEAYLSPSGDYAHINSLQWLDNGDIVASFRNLSSVFLIAGSDHDGHLAGDVIWRLGGKQSSFTFVDDPDWGPCAQHSAYFVDPTHLRIFDNGAELDPTSPIAGQTADMCGTEDPEVRTARPDSRVTTYALDVNAGTATLTEEYAPGRYASFAGNWGARPGGNTVIGWSRNTESGGGNGPIATEVAPDGTEVFSVSSLGWFSYRVWKVDAPDAQRPKVTLDRPDLDGSVLEEGDRGPRFRWGCTDTGGSNLAACTGTVGYGSRVPATPGSHRIKVRAEDGAGNVRRRTVSYDVRPVAQPDLLVRKRGGQWVGRQDDDSRVGVSVTPGRKAVLRLRVVNRGHTKDRIRLRGPGDARGWTVRYRQGGQEVTGRVVRGDHVLRLGPGEKRTLTVVLRNRGAELGSDRTLRFRARSLRLDDRRDVVRVVARSRR